MYLAQKKHQSVDQLKAKSKEQQQFWQDLVDEVVEIEAELKKKKGDKALTKQRELKLKAVAKAEAVSKAANGDVDEALRAIESVTENFSDEYLKPILGAAMQLEKWQAALRKHFHSVNDIDLAAGRDMKQRLTACERYLK